MTPSLRRRELLAGCAGAATLALAGCLSSGSLDASESVSLEADAAAVDAVSVTTENGDIYTRGEPTETVDIDARKRAADEGDLDDVTVETEQRGGELSLVSEVDSDGGLLPGFDPTPRLTVDLVVPGRGTETETPDRLEWVTTNGDITAESVGGEVTAEATNGDVELDRLTAASVTVDTTNGDVTVDMVDTADVVVDTTNGDVELNVPSEAEPELVFDTTNGGVTVEGLDAERVDTDGSTETTIGAGTHRIEVTTTNGDLDIRGREA